MSLSSGTPTELIGVAVRRSWAGALMAVATTGLLAAGCASSGATAGMDTQPSQPAPAAAAAPAPAAAPAAAPAPAAAVGFYTDAQARRGRGNFEAACTSCHSADDFGGTTFKSRWGGASAYDLFDMISAAMPQDNPGSLERQQYADIIAFFLSRSDVPSGGTELMAAEDALRAVTIPRP
jgi:hypothetical protein